MLFIDDVSPQYFIVVEQELLIECKDLVDALCALLAVHYVFNIEYHPRLTDFFIFLEEKIIGMKPSNGKKSPTYLNMTSAVQCFLQ